MAEKKTRPRPARSKKTGTSRAAKTKSPTRARTTARRAATPTASLEAALAELPAGAADQPPDLPVAIALQEANDVATAARKHAARLRRLPFDHRFLEELPVRIRWLRDAESDWRSVRVRRTGKATGRAREKAEELRRELIEAGRYLLRDDAEAQSTLDLISEGEGLADLIEDLHALVRFAHARGPALAAADIAGGIERALDQATGLAEELAEASSTERADDTALAALGRRNACYALLARAVREVRAAARYALRKDPVALRPFRSDYLNRLKRASRARKGAAAAGAATPPAAGVA